MNSEMSYLEWMFGQPPLYTKENLKAAEDSLIEINLRGGQFTARDITGVDQTGKYPLPQGGVNPQRIERVMVYQSYHQLAFPNLPRGQPLRVPDHPFEKCAYGPGKPLPNNKGDHNPALCCNLYGTAGQSQGTLFKAFETGWQASPFCEKLVAHLETHAGSMDRVMQVVGIGLGALRLDDSEEPGHIARSYLQHIAAVVIRDTLKRVQGTLSIRIMIQDPGYCGSCRGYLASAYNMFLCTDPGAFLAVDNSTFVLSIAPGVNARQIVMDVTDTFGGPAGMLCDVIDDDGMVEDPFLDPSSPRCYAYMQNSSRNKMAIELDDTGDHVEFGEHDNMPAKVFGRVGLYLKKNAGGDS